MTFAAIAREPKSTLAQRAAFRVRYRQQAQKERVIRGPGVGRGQSPLGWTRVLARSALSRSARSASSSGIVWQRGLACSQRTFGVSSCFWILYTHSNTYTHAKILRHTGTKTNKHTDTGTQTHSHTQTQMLVHSANGLARNRGRGSGGCQQSV